MGLFIYYSFFFFFFLVTFSNFQRAKGRMGFFFTFWLLFAFFSKFLLPFFILAGGRGCGFIFHFSLYVFLLLY